MTILERIDQEIKRAMKAREEMALSVNRMIKTVVKNREIELRAKLSEVEFRQVLSSMVKRAQESIEGFKKGGRPEMAEKEEAEIKIIQTYLPKPLEDHELMRLIDCAVTQANAKGGKDMGAVMKLLKEETMGRVDGQVLATKVKEKLNSL